MQPPVLAFPDPDKKYQVVTDASGIGIAAVLLQDGKAIAYDNRKLSPAERNYTTTEQELLAVVHALRVWQCYLEGAQFEVVTDHCPNTYLPTQPNLSRRQTRWSEFLQRFGKFDWTYKPGKTNIADPLSRSPVFLTAVSVRPWDSPWDDCPAVHALRARSRRNESGPCESIAAKCAGWYDRDPWFTQPNIAASDLQRKGELWYHKNRLVVPDAPGLRDAILAELHDAPYSGHGGFRKTLEAVKKDYWWPKLAKSVGQWVATCDSCQRNKASTKKPVGLLQPLQIPEFKFQSIGWDFVTHLPETPNGNDAILVMVDRLTKLVRIVPCSTSVTAEGTAKLFYHNWHRFYG